MFKRFSVLLLVAAVFLSQSFLARAAFAADTALSDKDKQFIKLFSEIVNDEARASVISQRTIAEIVLEEMQNAGADVTSFENGLGYLEILDSANQSSLIAEKISVLEFVVNEAARSNNDKVLRESLDRLKVLKEGLDFHKLKSEAFVVAVNSENFQKTTSVKFITQVNVGNPGAANIQLPSKDPDAKPIDISFKSNGNEGLIEFEVKQGDNRELLKGEFARNEEGQIIGINFTQESFIDGSNEPIFSSKLDAEQGLEIIEGLKNVTLGNDVGGNVADASNSEDLKSLIEVVSDNAIFNNDVLEGALDSIDEDTTAVDEAIKDFRIAGINQNKADLANNDAAGQEAVLRVDIQQIGAVADQVLGEVKKRENEAKALEKEKARQEERQDVFEKIRENDLSATGVFNNVESKIKDSNALSDSEKAALQASLDRILKQIENGDVDTQKEFDAAIKAIEKINGDVVDANEAKRKKEERERREALQNKREAQDDLKKDLEAIQDRADELGGEFKAEFEKLAQDGAEAANKEAVQELIRQAEALEEKIAKQEKINQEAFEAAKEQAEKDIEENENQIDEKEEDNRINEQLVNNVENALEERKAALEAQGLDPNADAIVQNIEAKLAELQDEIAQKEQEIEDLDQQNEEKRDQFDLEEDPAEVAAEQEALEDRVRIDEQLIDNFEQALEDNKDKVNDINGQLNDPNLDAAERQALEAEKDRLEAIQDAINNQIDKLEDRVNENKDKLNPEEEADDNVPDEAQEDFNEDDLDDFPIVDENDSPLEEEAPVVIPPPVVGPAPLPVDPSPIIPDVEETPIVTDDTPTDSGDEVINDEVLDEELADNSEIPPADPSPEEVDEVLPPSNSGDEVINDEVLDEELADNSEIPPVDPSPEEVDEVLPPSNTGTANFSLDNDDEQDSFVEGTLSQLGVNEDLGIVQNGEAFANESFQSLNIQFDGLSSDANGATQIPFGIDMHINPAIIQMLLANLGQEIDLPLGQAFFFFIAPGLPFGQPTEIASADPIDVKIKVVERDGKFLLEVTGNWSIVSPNPDFSGVTQTGTVNINFSADITSYVQS